MERRLKLVNKNDETLDFMEVENFGHSPEGLGLEMDNVVYQAYSSFTNVQLNIKRNEIKLKITTGAFSDKPYATFHSMLKFLNVGGLKLYYDVPNVGEFIRDVSFQKITKTDAAEFHVLQEELDLSCNTPWYSWETIAKETEPVYGAGKIYDDEYSIAPGDQLAPNWEFIDPANFATAPLIPGVIVGASSDFSGYGSTDELHQYGITRWGRFTIKTATGAAGFRFDTAQYTPGIKVKKGDLYRVEYFIKNDGPALMPMNPGQVSFRNDAGTLTPMTLTDKNAPKTIDIPNDNTWHKVTGYVYEAQESGYAPVGYAYNVTANAGIGATAIVAGFKLSRVSTIDDVTVGGAYNWRELPEGPLIDSSFEETQPVGTRALAEYYKGDAWQAWAQGENWLTTLTNYSENQNVLTLDEASSQSFVRSNLAQELLEGTRVEASFKARLTFGEEENPTVKPSNIFRLSFHDAADTLVDYTYDNTAKPAFDSIFISNSGAMSGGTSVGATLVSSPADPTDGEWHDYVISFVVPAGQQFVHSMFFKTNTGFVTDISNFELSAKGGSVQKEADGPYSVISPRTTIYQIDYTKIAPLLDIENDSMYFGTQTDSSLRVTIRAKDKVIENPKWYLRDLNMTIKQSEGYNLRIEPGNYLVVSSDPFERYTRLYDGADGSYQDVSTAIDPSTQGWIRIPVGLSHLELDTALAADTQGFGGPNITVEYKKEWLVV